MAQHYVATFDLRRRCAPYLTYYRHGDTRKRGTAMLEIKAAYRLAGFTPCEDELPDYLPLVLDFAVPSPQGETLLRRRRADVELLRRALGEAGTRPQPCSRISGATDSLHRRGCWLLVLLPTPGAAADSSTLLDPAVAFPLTCTRKCVQLGSVAFADEPRHTGAMIEQTGDSSGCVSGHIPALPVLLVLHAYPRAGQRERAPPA